MLAPSPSWRHGTTRAQIERDDRREAERHAMEEETMRFIPTWLHGIVDYLTVGALLAVPRVRGWNKPATATLTMAASGLLGYSICTRYELGLLKWIPMPVHLALDGMSGAALCAAPFLLPAKKKQRGALTLGFLAFGLMELFFALFTKTRLSAPELDVVVFEAEMVESLQEQLP
jgi:hypothetical protein